MAVIAQSNDLGLGIGMVVGGAATVLFFVVTARSEAYLNFKMRAQDRAKDPFRPRNRGREATRRRTLIGHSIAVAFGLLLIVFGAVTVIVSH